MSRNPEGPRLIWSLSKRAFTAGAEQALSQIPELSNEPAGLWKTAPHLYYALGGKRFPGFQKISIILFSEQDLREEVSQ